MELRRAARMGHEVVLFQILSRDEIELPYRRDLEFADLESGRTLAINAGLARRRLHRRDGGVSRAMAQPRRRRRVSVFADRHRHAARARASQFPAREEDAAQALGLTATPMLWLNPSALFALAAVAAPILIHILIQRRAERFPFPTLRFLQPTRLAAIRRHLLEDLPLLAVRIALLAAAVAALAGPLLVTSARRQAWDRRVVRAIVTRYGRRGASLLRPRPASRALGSGRQPLRQQTFASRLARRRHPPRDPLARHRAAGAPGNRDRVAVSDRIDHRRRHRRRSRRHRPPFRADRHAAGDADGSMEAGC